MIEIILPNAPYERDWRDDVIQLISEGKLDEALKVVREHKDDKI